MCAEPKTPLQLAYEKQDKLSREIEMLRLENSRLKASVESLLSDTTGTDTISPESKRMAQNLTVDLILPFQCCPTCGREPCGRRR